MTPEEARERIRSIRLRLVATEAGVIRRSVADLRGRSVGMVDDGEIRDLLGNAEHALDRLVELCAERSYRLNADNARGESGGPMEVMQ